MFLDLLSELCFWTYFLSYVFGLTFGVMFLDLLCVLCFDHFSDMGTQQRANKNKIITGGKNKIITGGKNKIMTAGTLIK
jgi:hypothetical protein